MSDWGKAQTADGKTYYWNKITKATSWTAPEGFVDEASAPAVAPAAATSTSLADWSEAKTPEGRPYYYNRVTRVTAWEPPPGWGQQQNERPAPDFVAGGGGGGGFGGRDYDNSDRRMARRDNRDHGLPMKPSFDGPRDGGRDGGRPWEGREPRQDGGSYRGAMPVKTDEPDYATAEQAEEAFFKLLKSHKVAADTEWLDVMRMVIREREYRAIKDPNARRMAFDKYCHEARAQEKEKEKERRSRIKEDFRHMLTTHEEIKHYTRWKTARPLLERESVFKAAGDEEDKRRMFDEYILDLKKRHVEREDARKKQAMEELGTMLKALILDSHTSWPEAEETIMNNERFVQEDVFKALHKWDVFNAFEQHQRDLDRIANEVIQKDKAQRKRRQRKARDGYSQLLREKLKEGLIKPGSRWEDFYPHIKDDERFDAYLGQPGSSPLELFWDMVEDEDRKLRSMRNDALDVLEELRFEVTTTTPLKEFADVMHSHPKMSGINSDQMSMVYDRIIERIKQRAEKDKFKAERDQRDLVDTLRSAMRKVEPPIHVDDRYEDVAARLSTHRDFEAADEDTRKQAFSKFIRRLREKEEERETSRRERDRERADRERERDRHHRNGSRRDDRDMDRSDRHRTRSRDHRDRRHRTRSPEIDAYEADRRKAQEDRVRSSRKASFGLTPPPRDIRDRRSDDRYDPRERERDRDRRPPTVDRHDEGGISVYDRERRERAMERERHYVNRADPRDKGRTLDYGDDEVVGSRPGSVRKRRESEGSMGSRRESKVCCLTQPYL
jgi:pre-mRNA-processing factor 40